MKILLLSLCWLAADAVYISRMATVSRGRQPSVFRPGVTMQRPWAPPRLVQAASHRAPYVLYRGGPHSRMATVSRGRQPSVFRPGVTVQRPWAPPRLVQAASHRAPYVLYRGGPHRYISKPYTSAPRTVFTMGSGQWKTTTRLQHTASTPEYEFVRAAASHARPNGGTG
ncbi:unnamed protein product [Plutella xylostella]|uniref:(diamondback moth) hypothetical protein n=1 Tax=Plutella xylostella TaxID=51655 RepID=A0A8S4G8I9_PLUXY|nr:unnamed protein product [Plutella xylostella]